MVRDAVPLAECARALVIKLRHHGDVLLASPVLGVLKAHAPRMEVDALVYDETAAMLDGHPALARVHTVGRGWRELGVVEQAAKERSLVRALRGRRYDLVVHLTDHARGAWLSRLLGARYSVAPLVAGRGRWWRGSFTHFYPLIAGRHRVEANLDALRRIGLQPALAERKVQFVPGREAEERVAALGLPPGFVHVHPASRWTFKCWPAERNAQLLDRLAADGQAVVVTAAPDETALVDAILERTASKPLNLAGQLSLKELGALTARAQLFIGVDSMPMHLAAAMGIPTVALFGPSSEVEWGPWNVEQRVVTTTHSCRPCGFDGCGSGKVSECLTFLPVDAVHAAARELLARAACSSSSPSFASATTRSAGPNGSSRVRCPRSSAPAPTSR
jgi:heptosyltransferase-3